MKPQAQQKLNDYIRRISSDNPNDWPKSIDLANLDLTDEDIQPLRDAISNKPKAAQAIVKLDLANNQLTSFSGEGLEWLSELYLPGNQLTSFSGEGLGWLEMLGLANNKLTSFSGEGLGALQTLSLANNKLTSFRGEGLRGLYRLFLENNQLTSFSCEGLRSLQWLFLENNQLISFSSKGVQWLERLDLSGNQLTSFSWGQELVMLQVLNLTNNQLTSVCKIMLAARGRNLLRLDYDNPINQQALTNEMLAEHFYAALNNTVQRELGNTMSWLSAVRSRFGLFGLPDELCKKVFELAYGLDHILQKIDRIVRALSQEIDRIKETLPGQIQNLQNFVRSDEFAEFKKQYGEIVNSFYKDSFRDGRTMKTLLTAYKRHGKYTTNLRYLQDNSRLDPRDNPFQLALRN